MAIGDQEKKRGKRGKRGGEIERLREEKLTPLASQWE
jgi:hypothetical protein